VHLPFFGSPIVPSFFGQKYTSGLVRGPKTSVYINRGIGVIYSTAALQLPPGNHIVPVKNVKVSIMAKKLRLCSQGRLSFHNKTDKKEDIIYKINSQPNIKDVHHPPRIFM
jgi:hypothetical protein